MTLTLTKATFWKALLAISIAAILGLLLWSQPWSQGNSETRKMTVSGEAVIAAEPDQFTFQPYFQERGDSQEEVRKALSAKANEAVEELKKLGVEEKNIKLDANSYDQWYWSEGEEGIMSAHLNIEVTDKDLAQKIQDYFLNTSAEGQLTPQSTFSEEKKKQLDAEATDKAIEDARQKAEAQASKLGVEVGDVLEYNQAQDTLFPTLYGAEDLEASTDSRAVSLPVLEGQNEYRQTVTVTFRIR